MSGPGHLPGGLNPALLTNEVLSPESEFTLCFPVKGFNR